jgi:2-keto-4-pentenoate hydratase
MSCPASAYDCDAAVVTTGVATEVFEAGAGDSCVADFGPFGTVTVAFA